MSSNQERRGRSSARSRNGDRSRSPLQRGRRLVCDNGCGETFAHLVSKQRHLRFSCRLNPDLQRRPVPLHSDLSLPNTQCRFCATRFSQPDARKKHERRSHNIQFVGEIGYFPRSMTQNEIDRMNYYSDNHQSSSQGLNEALLDSPAFPSSSASPGCPSISAPVGSSASTGLLTPPPNQPTVIQFVMQRPSSSASPGCPSPSAPVGSSASTDILTPPSNHSTVMQRSTQRCNSCLKEFSCSERSFDRHRCNVFCSSQLTDINGNSPAVILSPPQMRMSS